MDKVCHGMMTQQSFTLGVGTCMQIPSLDMGGHVIESGAMEKLIATEYNQKMTCIQSKT